MHNVKIIERAGRRWMWPKYDVKLLQVFDQVNDIDEILEHVFGRSVCVQAGGACGVWPARLAEHFETVHTFEPEPTNFHCLEYNTRGVENIKRAQAPLGSQVTGDLSLHLDECEAENCGAHYTALGGNLKPALIDGLRLETCDLIQLDIEGSEFDALVGAASTLTRCQPVVVIEEKPLPHVVEGAHRMARQYLEALGYRQVGAIHRDVVFSC